ncbi:winged helix-turn-helix domain-containing protein [Dongshaea marina]|uniref:winged helix-turn-helix domain-containing protein n=1 Tax=Dongshaea marina TaxID=2047966 RepID=UPI001F28C3C3|nr:winged helix-turn-helix domain-containing protein [Dongshaea marina]
MESSPTSISLPDQLKLPKGSIHLVDGEVISSDGVKLIALGGSELALLRLLLEADGEVVERAVIFEAVWRDRVVTDNSLHVAINKLRKALAAIGDDASRIITVKGVGYRLYIEPDVVEPPTVSLLLSQFRARPLLK